uniref:C2H2-type domain-containing protein n=1 Tax=Kalanchoe fedtschenkoi TaxID=63787 RepID=A0A7N0TJT9_KALFE
MDTGAPQSSRWHSKNPVRWSEIKSALDPQELPDSPLLSQEVSYLKCKLCSQQYYSTINFRRHEIFHVRRRNNPNWLRETREKKALFEDFCHERSRDLDSFEDVEPKGVTWRGIIEGSASIPEPNIRLPRAYFKARNMLLDSVKSECSMSPDTILDLLSDGSENTFLYSDMDESVQNHVFKDAEKIAFAQENLVATACFLLEKKLRKTWKDEVTSLQNELIKEEEDEKTRQPKTETNKVEEKKKKKKKPKKQIVGDKSEEGNLEQTSDMQQSTATSGTEVPTSFEDSQTPEAQLEHLPDASQVRDAKKEDGECKLEDEGSKEPKIEEGNLGQTSDMQQSTATSGAEAPTSVEDSQTPVAQLEHLPDASQISDAKKEDGESKQKEEGSKELNIEEGNLGQTSDMQQSTGTSSAEAPTSVEDSETPVAQLEHLPDASQISDAKKEDGECKQKEDESKELKIEEEENKKKKKNKNKKKKEKKKKQLKNQIAEDKSEEGNVGPTSDTQQSTATSRPEVSTSVGEDSPAQIQLSESKS